MTTTMEPTFQRSPAWRAAGTVITSTTGMSRETVLREAGLNWTVEKVDCYAQDGANIALFDNAVAVIRKNNDGTIAPLAVRSPGFSVVQNDEMLETMEAIVDVSGGTFDSAGVLRNGRQVFACLTLPEGVQIGGLDAVGWSLLGRNAHDGSAAFTVSATPLRFRCTNMLRKMLRSPHSISIRHTRHAHLRIEQARRALDLTYSYQDEWSRWANSLMDYDMDTNEFAEFVKKIAPLPTAANADRQRSRVESVHANLMAIWSGETNENIAGTRWAAFNAVSEYAEWVRPVRGADDPGVARAARVLEKGMPRVAERAAMLLSAR